MSGITIAELCACADLTEKIRQEFLDLEKRTADKKEELRRMEEDTLPSMMIESGAQEIKTTLGVKYVVKEDVRVSLPAKALHEAVDWLLKNNHSGIVKTNVTIPFPTTESKKAFALAERLARTHKDVLVNSSIHASTLKSWVKEQRLKGREVPDAISVTPFDKATRAK